jgi:RNA-binding protein
MITSKNRAELRSRANELETTLMIGKDGITDNLVDELDRQLEARELVKGRVLETALMTAREASDELCARLNAEAVSCVGNRFVVYRRSETLARKTGTAHPKVKVNPVRSGIRRRRAIARAERERRNTFFREAAIAQAKQRRKDAGDED